MGERSFMFGFGRHGHENDHEGMDGEIASRIMECNVLNRGVVENALKEIKQRENTAINELAINARELARNKSMARTEAEADKLSKENLEPSNNIISWCRREIAEIQNNCNKTINKNIQNARKDLEGRFGKNMANAAIFSDLTIERTVDISRRLMQGTQARLEQQHQELSGARETRHPTPAKPARLKNPMPGLPQNASRTFHKELAKLESPNADQVISDELDALGDKRRLPDYRLEREFNDLEKNALGAPKSKAKAAGSGN